MVNPNRFYTNAYLREDRAPYYIGKGSRNRIYSKYGSEIKPPKDKSRIIFLKQNLTEEEAFKHEIYMIAVFGRKDLGTGILHNKTNGGDGSSGAIRSDETKRKMSEFQTGKKLWNDGRGNSTFSKECPGPNWVLGASEDHRKNIGLLSKERNTGKKWWNDKCGNNKLSIKCPGPNWSLGLSEEHKIKIGKSNGGDNSKIKGTRWWNDGYGNSVRSIECPGPNWSFGLSEKHKNNKNKAKKGMKWWNNGCGDNKLSIECPGPNWVRGMTKRTLPELTQDPTNPPVDAL